MTSLPIPADVGPPVLVHTQPARTLRILAVAAGTDASVDALREIEPWIREAGGQVEITPDLPRAARRVSGDRWGAVFVVIADSATEELAWWAETTRTAAGSPRVVVLTERPSMSLALLAEQVGVLDVLTMPCRRNDIAQVVGRLHALESEQALPFPRVDAEKVGPYLLVGKHAAMHDVYKLVARVAQGTATVLIQGESGTGKEVVARAIHVNGARAKGPFVAVNCAAIPENLLESELFGHEKGAFTGAVTRKAGRFELAVGGTLFLDEIADMSLPLQAKILRAVQEREIERVGGTETISVDVRLIAATNRNMRKTIADGKFREDLYYRLAVVTMQLPRLAERGTDLLLLTAHFAQLVGEQYGKPVTAISDRALAALERHSWPGNVRELRNVIERAVIVASDSTLRIDNLPDEFRAAESEAAGDAPLAGRPSTAFATLAELEARHITRALAQTRGVIGSASEILGIHRTTLARKMKEFGL
jgi:two-component system response regulator AtoC